jgi:hypothetical protein
MRHIINTSLLSDGRDSRNLCGGVLFYITRKGHIIYGQRKAMLSEKRGNASKPSS